MDPIPRNHNGYVYLIKTSKDAHTEKSMLKIGRSRDFLVRMKSYPPGTVILAVWAVHDAVTTEAALMKALCSCPDMCTRVKNEWFVALSNSCEYHIYLLCDRIVKEIINRQSLPFADFRDIHVVEKSKRNTNVDPIDVDEQDEKDSSDSTSSMPLVDSTREEERQGTYRAVTRMPPVQANKCPPLRGNADQLSSHPLLPDHLCIKLQRVCDDRVVLRMACASSREGNIGIRAIDEATRFAYGGGGSGGDAEPASSGGEELDALVLHYMGDQREAVAGRLVRDLEFKKWGCGVRVVPSSPWLFEVIIGEKEKKYDAVHRWFARDFSRFVYSKTRSYVEDIKPATEEEDDDDVYVHAAEGGRFCRHARDTLRWILDSISPDSTTSIIPDGITFPACLTTIEERRRRCRTLPPSAPRGEEAGPSVEQEREALTDAYGPADFVLHDTCPCGSGGSAAGGVAHPEHVTHLVLAYTYYLINFVLKVKGGIPHALVSNSQCPEDDDDDSGEDFRASITTDTGDRIEPLQPPCVGVIFPSTRLTLAQASTIVDTVVGYSVYDTLQMHLQPSSAAKAYTEDKLFAFSAWYASEVAKSMRGESLFEIDRPLPVPSEEKNQHQVYFTKDDVDATAGVMSVDACLASSSLLPSSFGSATGVFTQQKQQKSDADEWLPLLETAGTGKRLMNLVADEVRAKEEEKRAGESRAIKVYRNVLNGCVFVHESILRMPLSCPVPPVSSDTRLAAAIRFGLIHLGSLLTEFAEIGTVPHPEEGEDYRCGADQCERRPSSSSFVENLLSCLNENVTPGDLCAGNKLLKDITRVVYFGKDEEQEEEESDDTVTSDRQRRDETPRRHQQRGFDGSFPSPSFEQFMITMDYVAKHHDDSADMPAHKAVDHAIEYIRKRHSSPDQINRTQVPNNLSTLVAKKTRRAKGIFYGLSERETTPAVNSVAPRLA